MVKIPDKHYYRPDELAAAIDVPIKTVYRLMGRGYIRHVHMGRSARISREEFIRILNGGLDLSRSARTNGMAGGGHRREEN